MPRSFLGELVPIRTDKVELWVTRELCSFIIFILLICQKQENEPTARHKHLSGKIKQGSMKLRKIKVLLLAEVSLVTTEFFLCGSVFPGRFDSSL